MASVPQSSAALPLHSGFSATIRIEPPRGLLELRLREVWAYRELLYFFVWRDVKIRYKQTAVGVLWVVLQPVLTMLAFTLFFGRQDRKSTRLNSSHVSISYAVFCLKKKNRL